MSDDLINFLRERLDEDERAARATTEHQPYDEWDAVGAGDDSDAQLSHWEVVKIARPHPTPAAKSIAEHIARQDPTRVLREVEWKRRALDASNDDCSWGCTTEHSFSGSCGLRPMGPAWEANGHRWVQDDDGNPTLAPTVTPFYVLRLLALSYADHPDYRPEWRS
ncbi:DUF6221 family protein [Streptomyces albus]